MGTKVLVLEKDKVISSNKMRENFENLFREMSSYPLATPNQLRGLAAYEWHSNDNREKAGEDLACSLVAARKHWPAQAEERFIGCLKAYDTDRVEKAVSEAKLFYPKAKLFGVSDSKDAPIVIEGDKHIWQGQRLDELKTLTRVDQLIPTDAMKRVYDIERRGYGFENDYALFWPYGSYEESKAKIFRRQVSAMKENMARVSFLAKSGAKLIKDKALSVKDSVANVMAPVAGGVISATVGAAGFAGDFARGVAEGLSEIDLRDPVLAGIIIGSINKDFRIFFIEVARWE